MIKKVMALLAVALTAMLLLPSDPADARRGGGGGGGFRAMGGGGHAIRAGGFRAPVARAWSAPRHYAPRVVVRRPVYTYHRPIVRRIYRTPVLVTGYGRCEWLRRRALATGSSYWWRRYRQCRGWY